MNIIELNELYNNDLYITHDEVKDFLINIFGSIYYNKLIQKLILPPKYLSIRINEYNLLNHQNHQNNQSIEDKNNENDETYNTVDDIYNKLINILSNEYNNRDYNWNNYLKFYNIENYNKEILLLEILPPINDLLLTENRPNDMVIIDRIAGEAVLRGSDLFCPGVLSISSGLKSNTNVSIYFYLPNKNGKNLTKGQPLVQCEGTVVFIGVGIALKGKNEIFRSKNGIAVKILTRVYGDSIPLSNILPNFIYAQNLPSILVSHILDPQPNEYIFDMCAAPGGKTIHIAQLIRNEGFIVAGERHKKKVKNMKEKFLSLNLSCIQPIIINSLSSVLKDDIKDQYSNDPYELINTTPDIIYKNVSLKKIKGFHPESFDKILLDPPCSALGLRPKLNIIHDLDSLNNYISSTHGFFWSAINLLKPNGILVYSTCTINPKENEEMVAYILNEYPCLELITQEPYHLGNIGLDGFNLTENDRNLVQRFDLIDLNLDTNGFFCAKFKKISSFINNN